MPFLAGRLIIFLVLGPLIGLVAALAPFALAAGLTGTASGAGMPSESDRIPNSAIYLGMIGVAYGIGTLPALAAAAADWHYRDDEDRTGKTAAVGFIASAVLAAILLRGSVNVALASAAIAGGSAALACSVIRQRLEARRRA